MVETQILVAGGGPAGVISALTSAKMGNEVILVDAKQFGEIGNKICGDGLIKSSVTFLKNHLGIDEPTGKELESSFQKTILRIENADLQLTGIGYMVNRSHYGQRLLKEAENYGVEVRANTKAKRAVTNGDMVNGAVVQEKGKKEYTINAQVTIDCTGRSFQIRRTLPKEKFPFIEKKMDKRDVAASYREIIQLESENHSYQDSICLEFRENIPKGGYFWQFGKGKKRLNVGIGWPLDVKSHKGMKEHFRDILHEYYPPNTYKTLVKGGYTIPMRYPLMNAVASGFMTAGDAAFHANPFSAEGHGSALIAGYYAGKVAAEAIKKNDVSQQQLWKYNNHIIDHFGLVHIKYQLISEALNRSKISNLKFLLNRSIFSQEQFTDLIKGKGMGILTKLQLLIKGYSHLDILYRLSKMQKEMQFFEHLLEKYPKNPEQYPEWYTIFSKKMGKIRQH